MRIPHFIVDSPENAIFRKIDLNLSKFAQIDPHSPPFNADGPSGPKFRCAVFFAIYDDAVTREVQTLIK